ncbi:ATP-binding cassette domain-containing protein [Cohnella sp. GCM10027633]|uniref:ATP-binding cassette domain-containing protein n=1 Tax=unclassified Cohnella TaxID=2636738 RepID=UPI0036267D4C
MNQPAIETIGLRKRYGDATVLGGIDLAVPAGKVFALLGPNGAGKTTLIHILSTLTAADAGIARVAGFDVSSDPASVRSAISLTGQFAAVDEALTGQENLRMLCRLSGLTATASRERTVELLAYFDLEAAAGKLVRTYSGGMRRRLDLALSLAAPRPVLFLDEPTTGLDAMSRRALWAIIEKLREQGITIFLTTQYLEEADELADLISVLVGGRIVATGTAEELKSRVGGEVIELRDENDAVVQTIATDGTLQDVGRALQEAMRFASPHVRVGIRKPSMEDVFLALTGKQSEVAV